MTEFFIIKLKVKYLIMSGCFEDFIKFMKRDENEIKWLSLNKSITADDNAWQRHSTPDSICDQMVELHKPEFYNQQNILVLFNVEFIKSIYIKYDDVIYKNIYFVADTKEKFNWVKNNFSKINCAYLDMHDINKLNECIKGFNVKKFDVVFSNPPYNDGLDLKILTNIKNTFKKAIIVHPAVWILSNKETGKFDNFKKEFQNNIEKVVVFRGSEMFGVPFMSALDICIFNTEKTDSKIEVEDQVLNCKYTVENYKDITHYGDMWFKIGIKDFIEKCKSYKSILDVENRFPHFKFPDKINFPINITEFRAGNPHFNDGYYDETLGYYVLNKTNYFFTCIAKGDPEKYHFKFDNKHVVLSYNFNTAVERLNFYNYCKSKVFRFILSYLKVNAHNNTGELKNTPWLDFTKEWNDAKLCKEFGISEELWKYIDNFIPDYYEDYKSGF
jgi:hypothetical protein